METKAERRSWWTAIGLTLLIAATVMYAMFTTDYNQPEDNFRLEAAKLVLQFLLVGMGGTLVLAYLNARRDAAEREARTRAAAEDRANARRAAEEQIAANASAARQERAAIRRAALQELIRKIGDAHRRLKVVKRQLRAAILREEPDPKGPPARPYYVPGGAFERAMEALLGAQISAEEVRDQITMSVDLLSREEITRIRTCLRYGARYFHDVYEDYEHCRAKRDGDRYSVTLQCKNLHNFLFAKEPPTDLPADDTAALKAHFDVMKQELRSLDERYGALASIEEMRCRDPGKRRYRAIATECFGLAADDLRRALWSTCLPDGPEDAVACDQHQTDKPGNTTS